MDIFFITLITLLIILLLCADWLVHISMVKGSTDTYGWGTYDKFVSEFNKCNWDNENWKNDYSLWDRDNGGKIHASIITFESVGMIIRNPIDYYKVKLFVRKYFKDNLIPVKNKIKNYKW